MGTTSCCNYQNENEITFGTGIYDFKKTVSLNYINLIIYFIIRNFQKVIVKKNFLEKMIKYIKILKIKLE